MRQLGTLPTAAAARTLADYFRSLKIDTRLLQEADGWSLWVCDEDHVPQAREEFAQYQRNPSDPRFAAHRTAALREPERPEPVPQRPRRPRRRRDGPVLALTTALIIASVGVSLFTMPQGGQTSEVAQALFIAPFQVEGNHYISWHYLDDILSGQVWRLVTPIFIHFSFAHLFFDMYMLWYFGAQIESGRGPLRYGLLVLFLATVSNVLQYYLGNAPSWAGPRLTLHPSPLFGGMSGVVYGLFGYVWMKARFEPRLGLWVSPATIIWLVAWLVLCFTEEFQKLIGAHVANTAHLAGLLGGMAVGVMPVLLRSLWRWWRGD
jgi:GlpG protein